MDTLAKIWPQWKVEGLIGTGSYGKVYKIKREEMGTISYAALKVLELPQNQSEVRELASSGMDNHSIQVYYDNLMKKLQNEICVMETLKTGNNIVSIEDYAFWKKENEIGWKLYIRMELLMNLDTYWKKMKGQLPVTEVIKLGMDICAALECCEKAKIIHRDIKPDNIFRNPYGDYKLGDFGIARHMEETRTAYSQRGTIRYMAPEVYYGKHYNNLVDIYSLGLMLYRILNQGRLPFMPPVPQQIMPEDAERAIQKRMLGEKLPCPAGAPLHLGKVILKACAYEPKERYQSASEFKDALMQCLRIEEAEAECRKNTDKGNLRQKKKNKRKIVIAVIAVGIVILVAGAFVIKEMITDVSRSIEEARRTERSSGQQADRQTNQQEAKLPDNPEDKTDNYTWKVQPEIEADDIYYVRASDFQGSSMNANQKQRMSFYAVIEKENGKGLISMDGDMKTELTYSGVYSDPVYEYTLSKYDEAEAEWIWEGLENDSLTSVTPDDTGKAACLYYFENALHSTEEEWNSGWSVQDVAGVIPVQQSERRLSAESEWPAGGTASYAIYGSGRLVTDFIYDECGSESDGMCAVKKDGKWGYVNEKGELVIPIEYDASWLEYLGFQGEIQKYCYAFSEGYIPLCKDGIWELRDTMGNIIILPGTFQEIRPVYQGCCWVKKDDRWGVIELK